MAPVQCSVWLAGRPQLPTPSSIDVGNGSNKLSQLIAHLKRLTDMDGEEMRTKLGARIRIVDSYCAHHLFDPRDFGKQSLLLKRLRTGLRCSLS